MLDHCIFYVFNNKFLFLGLDKLFLRKSRRRQRQVPRKVQEVPQRPTEHVADSNGEPPEALRSSVRWKQSRSRRSNKKASTKNAAACEE